LTRSIQSAHERRVRPALATEAPLLSALAIRSKAHWDYTAEQLAVFREELMLDAGDLRPGHVLEERGEALGFYTLRSQRSEPLELEHLFVEPDRLRGGCGAMLLAHAIETALALGRSALRVQSDPNAEGFYARFGFAKRRDIPTSIPGRTLPLMERALVSVAAPIHIEDARTDWPRQFRAEAARLRAALPDAPILGVEHFGSTAVPGLAAKPVLDLAILVEPPAIRTDWIPPLDALGYAYWAHNPDPHRMLFIKGQPPRGARRTHHLHVRTPDDLAAELAFRDALRADPERAARYAALKRELADTHRHDREAYTEGKTAFVRDTLRRA
jgi:GrpB-like predicted nucleotidyltransferase (UPF0157 family)/GNAT superfamily N-acetyltransferase